MAASKSRGLLPPCFPHFAVAVRLEYKSLIDIDNLTINPSGKLPWRSNKQRLARPTAHGPARAVKRILFHLAFAALPTATR